MTVETLANGMVLCHREAKAVPTAALTLMIANGARDDAEARQGRANLMMRLVGKGTKSKSADQIAEGFEDLGAGFGSGAGQDFCSAQFQCVAEDFSSTLPLFAEAVLEANFPWNEIETERGRVLAEIRARDDRTPSYAIRKLRKMLFTPHPYARPVEGEPETVADLKQDELARLHADITTPSRMIVAVSGDVKAGVVRKLLEKHFPKSAAPAFHRVQVDASLPPRGNRAVESRKVEQGFIALGHVTCAIKDADAVALTVASGVLGGGMSSRLFVELRDRKGLAYAVGAFSAFYALNGFFYSYIGTRPETMKEAEEGLWAETRRLRDEPVPEAELERARNYIIGNFLRDLETNHAQAARRAGDLASELGADFAERYPEMIRAVTSHDVLRVANRYFTDPTTMVVTPEAAR